ncbi:penicillin-binding protein activator [Candidatus Methylobacter favarea]|uniref:penicillin-binding protein activator n=1 Tax=Candidatus Methylobacter favarea TaxID=2707345 RepID=UPI001FE3F926|nr:penicillin-binding protein activator [Candidatus Methylobacter favarea]
MTKPSIQSTQPEQTPGLYQSVPPALSLEQINHRLQSIDSLIQAGESEAAKNTADTLDPFYLAPQQRDQLNLLFVQIMLSSGDAEQAIDKLALIQPQQLNLDNKIKYFQSQAFAFSLTGNLLDSAKARIELNSLLTSVEQRQKNQAAILETLGLLSDSSLQEKQLLSIPTLDGWISLARILKLKGQPDFNTQLLQWRAAYPGHPANSAFLENLLEKPGSIPFNSIAIFLPESGPFTQAGKAVRAGFMAAYNYTAGRSPKPVLRFYNSEHALPALFNQAVSEGAQLIIGPLSKESIQGLADSVIFTIPVLALNHIPDLQKDNLYQFALSPIDDVEEVTHRAWADGYQKALLLIPDTAQGKRIADYFTESWQRTDGTIMEIQAYNPKKNDFSSPIKKLLNLDESENRYNKMLELVPSLKFTPRRRQDADVILLSAYSTEARSINPQLQYYQAGKLPVYALPNIYTGQPNPSLDSDLDKITFCDMPWLLDKAYLGNLSMEALRDIWQQFPNAYLRLIAMGIDAYNLATQLSDLNINSYPGATGNLSLTDDNRIKRKLICATFTAGLPEVTGVINNPVESPDDTDSSAINNEISPDKKPKPPEMMINNVAD